MIIKKMKASFGCLEKAEMELHKGLNIVTASNESGKSTWCAFIRAMLYGVDSSQREKGGVKPDKVKYAPWSGVSMEGEMEIEHEGKDITLTRSTKLASAPMREFSAVYSGTAQSVEGLKGGDAGETLTGMPRAVFESSVFVRQSGMAVSNSAELEKRINAIISSGDDEGESFTDADSVLRAWLRKRRHNRSGAIPAVENEIRDVNAAINAAAGAVEQRTQLEQRLEDAKAAEAETEESVRSQLGEKRERLVGALETLRSDVSSLEKESAEAETEAKRLSALTEEGPFRGRTAEEAVRIAGSDSERLENFIGMVPGAASSFIFLAVGIAAFLIGHFLQINFMKVISFPIFMGFVISLALIKANKNRVKNYSANLIKYYEVEEAKPELIIAKAEAYAADCRAAEEAKALCDEIAEKLEAKRVELRNAEEELLSAGMDASESPAIARAKAETAFVQQQLARKEGEIAAMGDPMVMGTQLEALESRRDELLEQYEALEMAIATLREANDEMQQRFAPELGRRAGEIMARLTGGRYAALSFSRELDASAKREGDTVAHEKAFLSEGTADQLYLALRLAICELALPEGCSCPIILDDALVNFDDERMGYALELLEEMAEKRQIILFSCHDREEKFLKNR